MPETVTIYVEEEGEWGPRRLERQYHEPVDIDRQRRVRTTRVNRSKISVRRAISGVTVYKESPSQDALSRRSTSPGRGPKTLGDTNEFISAFWVKGKPKCRKGYTYDFRRKMCRRIQ